MLQVNEAKGGVPAALTKDTKLLRGSINRTIVNPRKNFLSTKRHFSDETGVNFLTFALPCYWCSRPDKRLRQNCYKLSLSIDIPNLSEILRKRELKRSIIRMIRNGSMYGYEIQKLLLSQGEKLQLSYLYKTLKEMSQEGILRSQLQHGDEGPQRRQYRLTAKGQKELGRIFGEATELVHDYYEEYVASLPPPFFSEKFELMMGEVYGGRKSVALIISEPLTRLHKLILDRLRGRKGGERTYLIKPSHIKVDSQLTDITTLDGNFEDIPMKDMSLDAIVAVDIQDAANLELCCRDLRRVLRSGGIMVACCPFLGLGGAAEPLEVGEYMKKAKYTLSGRPYLDKETLRRALAKNFDYVDIANMSFMTAFVAGLKPIELFV